MPRKKRIPSKWSRNDNVLYYHLLQEAELPHASFGTCFYAAKCGSWDVDLGNGLCGKCWDKGRENAMRRVLSKRQNPVGRNNQRQQIKPLSSYQSAKYKTSPPSAYEEHKERLVQ